MVIIMYCAFTISYCLSFHFIILVNKLSSLMFLCLVYLQFLTNEDSDGRTSIGYYILIT